MENVVHTRHSVGHRTRIPHIADIKLDLFSMVRESCLKVMPHIILLLLITAEDANLADVRGQEML